MDVNDPKWVTVTDSEHAHEREALAWLRRALPNSPVTRAWANFSMTNRNGAMYEVDVFVVTPAGAFLIEIKSHPGRLEGDAATWYYTHSNGRFSTMDNPRPLANKKAKVIASLLQKTKAMRAKNARMPFVSELVFLSDADLEVGFNEQGRFNVVGRDADDGAELPPKRRSIGGVVDRITSLEPRNGRPVRRIDRPASEAIAKAMDEIGIRELTSRRVVGDYRIESLLEDVDGSTEDGVTYQDFAAKHVSIDDWRRVRIYPLEHNATDEARLVATRAARREYELLSPIEHSGILRPVGYTETDRGPSLLFDYDADAVPLHRWLELPDTLAELTIEHRLGLIRQVAEAVHHAHQRGVSHRNLAPATILVSGSPDTAKVKITNWHAGARISLGSLSTAALTKATRHGTALSTVDASFYRAPEYGQDGARASLGDVFSVGAIAALILTGSPPARSIAAFDDMLMTAGCIDASAIGDNVDLHFVDFIAEATSANPADRYTHLGDLLAGLDLLEEAIAEPDDQADAEEPHVLVAKKGDVLGSGRFEVIGRLGSGSTAVAFEVVDRQNRNRRSVLKVATEPEFNSRLDDEAAALSELRHDRIVELLDDPFLLNDHQVLLLSHAGTTTLAARLADQPGAELAQRFGADLLSALRHLEERGVSHRDIKPDNIGVAPIGVRDSLRSVLFDFSLARAPLEAVDAGTQGYLDPFLKRRGRWDLHADRYSAAATLFEMASGTRPRYGDGGAHPATIDDGPTVEPTMFEPGVAAGLVPFFIKALAREVEDRFDTADEMARAWDRAFDVADAPASQPSPAAAQAEPVAPTTAETEPAPTEPADTEPASPADIAASTGIDIGTEADTPLGVLDVSRKALNALERLSIATAGQLAAASRGALRNVRGVGAKTRKEILSLNANLAAFFAAQGVDLSALADGDAEAPDESIETGEDSADHDEPAIDELTDPPAATQPAPAGSLIHAAHRLLPDADETNGTPRRALSWLVAFPPAEHESLASRWPSQKEPADAIGVTPGRIAQILTEARKDWARQSMVQSTGGLIASELERTGGLASIAQLSAALARAEAPGAPDALAEHRRAAEALVRAALYTESDTESPRWSVRRRDEFAVVAAERAAVDGDDNGITSDTAPSSQQLADYALALARATDEAVDQSGVVDRRRLAAILQAVEPPRGVEPADEAHLIELATDISASTAVNARLEVYRAGMEARHALQACRRSFVGVSKIKAEDIVSRVRSRFPEAERVPGRPELDGLLLDAGIDLVWSDETYRFEEPQRDQTGSATGTRLQRVPTGMPASNPITAVDLDEAREFERSISGWVNDGGLRVLVTSPLRLTLAANELPRLNVTVVDFDELLLDRLIAVTAGGKPSWDVVARADAGGPTGSDWSKLQRVLDREFVGLADDLFANSGTVVLHSLGLLARYDRVNTIAEWRERLHARTDALQGLWLLIPGADNAAAPMLGTDAVPILGPGEWSQIPTTWLENRHRSEPTGTP